MLPDSASVGRSLILAKAKESLTKSCSSKRQTTKVYQAPTTLKSRTSARSNRLWTRDTTITLSDLTTTVRETLLAPPAQTHQCALPSRPKTTIPRRTLAPSETSTVPERATHLFGHCNPYPPSLHRTFSNPPTLTTMKSSSR